MSILRILSFAFFYLLIKTVSSQSFVEVTNTPFEAVLFGQIAFEDIDDDNDQDVIIIGGAESGNIAKLYVNQGGDFVEESNTPFLEASAGAVVFLDVDNDNDPDVIISGDTDNGDPFAQEDPP